MSWEQETFNTVWNGLKSQGFAKSSNEDGDCMYRHPDGLKCAAGWLIPEGADGFDVKVHNGMEVYDVPLFVENLTQGQLDFLSMLQYAHDMSDDPEHMQSLLRGLAADYDLEVPA